MLAFGAGSDILTYDEEARKLVAKEFAMRTGRRVRPHRLVAKLESMRKRGLLPKVDDVEQREDQPDVDGEVEGFEDINDVG